MSRTNSAPISSKAHVSDETTQVVVFRLAERQRAEAHRIAHSDDRVLGQKDERIGAAHLAKRIGDAFGQRPLARAGDEVDDRLRVGGAREDRALGLEPLAQLDRVDQVAVVPDRHRPARVVDRDRLGVLLGRVARRRVADVPDGRDARQVLEPVGGEDVVDVPHLPHRPQLVAVGRDDPSRLLPAVLEGVQAEVGEVRRFRVSIDADDPAHGASKLAHRGGNKRTRSMILRSQDFGHTPGLPTLPPLPPLPPS